MVDCGETTTISVGVKVKTELEKEKNALGIQTWNEFFLKTHKIIPMLLGDDSMREPQNGQPNNMVGLGSSNRPIETADDVKRLLQVG